MKKQAKTLKFYALVRKRTLEGRQNKLGKKFIPWITFVMLISEYNENHKAPKSKSADILKCPTLIVHCNVGYTDLNTLKTHGNSKSNEAFQQTMHSTFQQCKNFVTIDERPVHFILDEFESQDDIFSRPSDSSVPKDVLQIYY